MTKTVYTDEDGMLFKYVCSYTYKGEEHAFTLWASSREEAGERLRAIGESGMVNGKLIKELPMRQGGQDNE
jgi:hypothetical protein